MNMAMRYIPIVLFALLSCVAWWPFDTYVNLYKTAPSGAAAAGEIVSVFSLSQTVKPVGNALSSGDHSDCFGIQFATYARDNKGQVEIDWRQGDKQQRWRVDMAEVADNSYRPFCPERGLSPDRPFEIRIEGVDGRPGSSATLWLVDDISLGTARLANGSDINGKSMSLEITDYKDVELPSSLWINQGAFLLGWLCSLCIGIFALGFVSGGNAEPKMASEPAS